ncbi:LPS assembly lipoprotein LptE [Palleronia sp.]|uniref:LPS assembly lipoprotein LptE n=1 Tax=Palleronia sp. TaxID=1940284 RepID=UPI0035C78E31
MSSSRADWTRRGLVAALAALPACGFRPVYGPGGPAAGLTGEIIVDEPVDEAGYALFTRLVDRLGQPASPRYRLAADVRISTRNLGRTNDNAVARRQLVGTVTYSLIDLETESVLRRHTLASFTGYSSPLIDDDITPEPGEPYVGSYYSVSEARRDAGERLMTILADKIVADLLATSPAWRT